MKPATTAVPPPGQTWDGSVEDVADRLGAHPYAVALGAISAIARVGLPGGATADDRIALIAKVLDALDLREVTR